jgi:polysaccharide biosynthesis transport protein
MPRRLDGERDLSSVIASVRRLWWLVVLVAAVSASGAYFLGNRQPTEYSATATLLFRDSQLDQGLLGFQAFPPSTDPTREPATNQALLGLPIVASRVAEQLRVPESTVQPAISIGSDAQSDVVPVTATDSNPRLAAALANAYVQQYIRFQQSVDRSQLSQAGQLLESELAAIPPSQRGSGTAQSLQARQNEIQLLATLQTGNAEVVQTATPPTSPSAPDPGRDALIGLILGLLVGVAAAAGLGRWDRRIRSRREIEELYRVPIIGAVPDSPALNGGGVGTARDQDAVRMIRAQLRYFNVDCDVKSILVTSAANGEGKSTVAMNLARIAARTGGNRVLLLEADLRRPSVAAMTGLENVAGLAALLSDFNDIGSGVRELVVTCQANDGSGSASVFDVLLAGARPPNPGELLDSTRMVELMDALSRRYDFIIIDAPAIGAVSDAVPLVHRADGVLVISRLGYSRRDHAIRLMEQLQSLHAHVLGVVINRFQASGTEFLAYPPYPSVSHRRVRSPERPRSVAAENPGGSRPRPDESGEGGQTGGAALVTDSGGAGPRADESKEGGQTGRAARATVPGRARNGRAARATDSGGAGPRADESKEGGQTGGAARATGSGRA